VVEITAQGDSQRFEFESRQYNSIAFATTFLKISFSCLGIVKELDVTSGNTVIEETVMSILKKTLRISL
jgi:hypothetical protein